MSLMPWKPYRPMRGLERQIDDLFDELIHEPWGSFSREDVWQPEIDIYETADAYIIEADLPGVLAKDVEFTVENHWVTIRGTRKTAGLVESVQGVVLERRQGSFSRRFYLDQTVDPEQAESRCEEGIYKVRLPKKKD